MAVWATVCQWCGESGSLMNSDDRPVFTPKVGGNCPSHPST